MGAVAGVERVLLRADYVRFVGLLVVQKLLAGGGLRGGEVDLEVLELVFQGEHDLEVLPDLDGLDGCVLGLLAAELLQALLAVLRAAACAHAVSPPARVHVGMRDIGIGVHDALRCVLLEVSEGFAYFKPSCGG